MDGGEQITILLQRLRSGDRQAESELMPIVYGRLHEIAERQFRLERPGHTLQPTALLGEFYLRIVRDTAIDWQNRSHFYVVAAQTLRRILVDYARLANANKRPSPAKRVRLEDVVLYSENRALEILMIDNALTKLKAWNSRQARVVELRFFGGLSVEETAAALGIAERTVKRDWTLARAWLSALINGNTDGSAESLT